MSRLLADTVPNHIPAAERGAIKLGTGIWTKQNLWTEPITDADLQWWLETAASIQWKWAKTYAKHTPHWYLQREMPYCPLTLAEYHRALLVIWSFGRPETFWSKRSNIYLHDEERNLKWFAAGAPDLGISLINQAQADEYYGHQPYTTFSTTPARATSMTAEAHRWDDIRPLDGWSKLWKLVNENDRHTGHVLDLTARTGYVADAKMVTAGAEWYFAVEPDRAMINRLVLKHPWARALFPMTVSEFYAEYPHQSFDTVIALEADTLTERELSEGIRRSRGLVLYVFPDKSSVGYRALSADPGAIGYTVQGREALVIEGGANG